MIDEQKRKMIVFGAIAFGIITIVTIVGFAIANRDSDLPPQEDASTQSQSSDEEQSDEATPRTYVEEVTLTKDGITFHHFEQLQQFAVTDSRIDVILYNLARYANSQRDAGIHEFTLDLASVRESTDGDWRTYTFNATANNNKTFKIELSYVYSADAFVRVYDENDQVVQSTY